jgi:hypothetical protein
MSLILLVLFHLKSRREHLSLLKNASPQFVAGKLSPPATRRSPCSDTPCPEPVCAVEGRTDYYIETFGAAISDRLAYAPHVPVEVIADAL